MALGLATRPRKGCQAVADEELGTGSVQIVLNSADAENEAVDLGRTLERILDRASRNAGRHIVRNLSRAIQRVDLTAQLQVTPDVDRSQFSAAVSAALAGLEVSVRVIPDLDGLTAAIRAYTPPDVTVNVNANIDTDRINRALGSLGGAASRAGSAVGSLLRLGAVGIAAAGAAQGVLALGAALAPAAGLLAAGPAVILGYQAALGGLKLALSGVKEAFGAALTGSADEFADALEGLSPKAQAAAREVRALKPAFEDLKSTVQDSFFAQVEGDITRTARALSGPLKSGLAEIAEGWGNAAQGVLGYIQGAQGVSNVQSVLDATGLSVQGLAATTNRLTAGFLQVAASVADAFGPQLSSGIEGLGTRVGEFLQRIASGGQAVAWVDGALNVFAQLGDLLGSIGGIIGGVFSAADTAGAGFLTRLQEIAAQVEGFVNSAAGQSAIGNIFQTLADVGAQLGPILAEVVRQVGAIAPAVGPALTTLGPAIQELVKGLGGAAQAALPDLVTAITNIADAVVTLAPSLAPVADALAALARSASDLLVPLAPLAGFLLDIIAPIVDFAAPVIVAAGALALLVSGISAALAIVPLITAAMTALGTAFVANPIGVVALAIIGVATAAYLLYQRFEPVREVVDAVGSALKTAFEGVVGFVSSAASAVADFVTGIPAFFQSLPATILAFFTTLGQGILTFFQSLPGIILGAMATVGSALLTGLTTAGTAILTFFIGLPAMIGNALLTVGQVLVTAFVQGVAFLLGALAGLLIQIVSFWIALPGRIIAAVQTLGPLLVSFFTSLFTTVTSAVASFVGAAVGFFTALPGRIMAAVLALPGLLLGLFNRVRTTVLTTVTGLVTSAVGFFQSLPGRALSALSSLVGTLTGVFNSAKSAVLTRAGALVAEAVALIRGLPGKAKAALGNLASTLVSVGGDLVNGFINGIKGAAGRVASAVGDLVSKAKDAFTGGLDIFSPSRVTRQYGVYVGQGFINGMASSESGVKAAADKLVGQIRDAFKGRNSRLDDVLIAQVRATEKTLLSLAKRRESIAARIKAANEFAASTAQSALQTGALGADSGAGGVQGITDGIEAAIKKVQGFNRQVASLARRGLRKDLLSQLIGLGPDQGAGLAKTLSNATGDQLKDLNEAQKQLAASAKSLGQTSADVLFDAGEQASKGFLAGLKAQQKDVQDLMLTLARAMAKSIRNALGIASPSKVFRGIGRYTMDGLDLGLRDRIATVRRTAVGAASAVSEPFGASPSAGSGQGGRGRQAGAQGSGGGSRTTTNTFNVYEVGNAAATAERILNRLAAASGL